MVEQECRDVGIFRRRLLELALEDELAALVCELQVHLLIGAELELLVQTPQVEAILGLAGLFIHSTQEIPDHDQDLRDVFHVRAVRLRVLEHVLQQQRVPGQSRGRFGQVTIKLQFPRLSAPLDLVHEP